jgi:hypothetical protein
VGPSRLFSSVLSSIPSLIHHITLHTWYGGFIIRRQSKMRREREAAFANLRGDLPLRRGLGEQRHDELVAVLRLPGAGDLCRGEYFSSCPMTLQGLECQLSKSVNSDTCPRPTTCLLQPLHLRDARLHAVQRGEALAAARKMLGWPRRCKSAHALR